MTKFYTFLLTQAEAGLVSAPVGVGGMQSLMKVIFDKVQNAKIKGGDINIELDDKTVGTLLRYMQAYKQGGYQQIFHKVFDRSFREKGLIK